MDTSTALSSPVQMSLTFATDDLVVLSFPPEVIISQRLSLSHVMGCPRKSLRAIEKFDFNRQQLKRRENSIFKTFLR